MVVFLSYVLIMRGKGMWPLKPAESTDSITTNNAALPAPVNTNNVALPAPSYSSQPPTYGSIAT